MSWYQFDNGKTIGQKGSEKGQILLDEEHEFGARITLEKVGSLFKKHFAITCGIYGWMIHTHFVSTKNKGFEAFQAMKSELDRILNLIPTEDEANDDNMSLVSDEISKFVDNF